MPLQFTWKKAIIGTLAMSLVIGGSSYIAAPAPVYAATTSAGLSTPFTDINKGHWAEKHIAKLALQGIITGYEVGTSGTYTFQPSKNVSQEEAVLMALRFAGLIDKVDTGADYGFPDTFVVSNYFKPYIVLAFNEGLLDSSELTIAAKDTSVAWGKRPASREWVTKLIIKAIGKSEVADGLQNTTSSFSDGGSIDPIYNGYVNAAAQLGLVKGITETKFDPKANVTRASLATIFSRAQSQFVVDYEGQTTGIATKITDSSITLYSNKVETSYALDENTLYYTYLNDSPITRAELLAYGDVTVIAKNGKALYVEAKGDTVHTTSTSGTFLRNVDDEKKLYLWINKMPVPFDYDDSVVVEDTEGTPLKLSDLKADSVVSIVQDTFRDKPLTLKIVTAPIVNQNTVKGLFFSTDGKIITIKSGNTLVTKYLAKAVDVEIEGLKEATLDDLLAETDQIELTLNADEQVSKIKVESRKVEVLDDSKIASFVEDMKLLTIVDFDGKNPKVLYLTDKTKVEYYGTIISVEGSYDLLLQGTQVILSYTGDKVVSIKIVTTYTGKFVSIDTLDYELKVKLDSGSTITLPYSANYLETPGSNATPLSELKKDDVITVELNPTQESVIKIKAHRNVNYKVEIIDILNKKIRVKAATGTGNAFDLSIKDLPLTNKDGKEALIGNIAVGDTITASYVGTSAVSVQLNK
ncbi:S-layer homology domain-containing protein [Paenibacillus sp. YIM B09110]|uniref:S-layer homology domain-containing protein n=1 Tax=Paenibacillus sp. YIM B09110 TaxID=3126102 RepID=UPI00301DEB65